MAWSYEFNKSWVTDNELDPLTFSCTKTPDPGWLTCSQNTTHVVFTGVPISNAHAGSYTISVIADDGYPDVDDYVWTEAFEIIPNQPPVIGSMSSQTMVVPDGLSWSYGASLTSDPEFLAYTKTLLFNGSSTIPAWLTYDLNTFSFIVVSTSNSIAGIHTITIELQDAYNSVVSGSFSLSIIENEAPQSLGYIDDIYVANYDHLSYTFDSIDELFSDPENREMTPGVMKADGNPLPSFLLFSEANNTMWGTPEFVHLGEWFLAYTATDDYGQQSNINFTLSVMPCYFRWASWDGMEYYQCNSWRSGYFYQFNRCNTGWSEGTFKNYDTKKCEAWHDYCLTWEDSSNTKCSECNEGYFQLGTTCLETCPSGYFNNYESYQCEECHSACTECFGQSINEWTACDSSMLYSLSGSQWNIPKCLVGQYLNHTDLSWYSCDSGCNVCEFPNNSYCQKCNSIHKEIVPGQCTHCDDITGYEINEFGVCSEVWGDGMIQEENECDDGNIQSGDGWSSTCKIEEGFACNGTTCWEIIRPTASIQSVSLSNVVKVVFSEPVYLASSFTDSIRTNIDGPLSPYTYSFSVVDADSFQLNKTYSEFEVAITDVQASLYGLKKEKLHIWFNDLTVVYDRARNILIEGAIEGYLNEVEYLAPNTKKSAEGGGKSMKFTIMSMFSINLLLKILISSSAALMWSLIHVLQVLRYILMMNIKMPSIINVVMKYLAIVIGEVDEIEGWTPDIFNEYIIDPSDISDNMVVLPRFEEYGYETPFLTDLYGRQIFGFMLTVLLGIPSLYLLMKLCKNVKRVKAKLDDSWTGMFWNGPLRTFIELFLEMSFGFYMHSLNVRFMTYSGVVATLIMF